jgi:hypothetical protein
MQVLPLIAVGLRRWRRSEASRVRMLFAAAASYAALFLLLLWQALSGESVIAGYATTSGVLVSLLVISIGVTWSRSSGAEPRTRTAARPA